MRRADDDVVLVAALALLAAAGSGRPGARRRARRRRRRATKLTVWVGWSARELSEFKKVVAEYDAKNAGRRRSRSSAASTTTRSSPRSARGNAPDVVSSFTSSNVGIYCSSGGWIDLAPYLEAGQDRRAIFPAATLYYTQYKGKRCALPLLADVYGFYYNKDALQEGRADAAAEDDRGADRRTRRS